MTRAYVGLGANLGDAAATVTRAIEQLDARADTRVIARSSLYRSAPVDAVGPDYVNAAVQLQTSLDPQALLEVLQQIERQHGRQRPHHHAPRTLDLDLLLHGDACLQTPHLTLPHPRLHLRAFVLRPLLELDPGLEAPGLGRLDRYLPATAGQPIARLP